MTISTMVVYCLRNVVVLFTLNNHLLLKRIIATLFLMIRHFVYSNT